MRYNIFANLPFLSKSNKKEPCHASLMMGTVSSHIKSKSFEVRVHSMQSFKQLVLVAQFRLPWWYTFHAWLVPIQSFDNDRWDSTRHTNRRISVVRVSVLGQRYSYTTWSLRPQIVTKPVLTRFHLNTSNTSILALMDAISDTFHST